MKFLKDSFSNRRMFTNTQRMFSSAYLELAKSIGPNAGQNMSIERTESFSGNCI